MKENRYMDIASLSEYIPLTKSAIYSMVRRDMIPYSKLGTKKLVFDRLEIDEWVKNGNSKVQLESVPKFINF